MKYKITIYETKNGNKPIEKYLEKLAKEHKIENLIKIKEYINLLERYGFEINTKVGNAIKLLRDKIYELRPTPTRILFFYYEDNKFVLLHAFEKKCQKTPNGEIELAIKGKK